MPRYSVFVKLEHLAKFVIEADSEDHARAIVDCGEQSDEECVDLQALGGEITTIELTDQDPYDGHPPDPPILDEVE